MIGEGTDVEGKVSSGDSHPDSVPWSQHVAAKETIGGKLKASEEKVKSLEEQLKGAPNAEEHSQLKTKLTTLETTLQEKEAAEAKASEKTVSELRATLEKQGLTEEQTKEMSEAEMKRLIPILGSKAKSLPDLSGGGGGSGVPQGTPMQLARAAYANTSKK